MQVSIVASESTFCADGHVIDPYHNMVRALVGIKDLIMLLEEVNHGTCCWF
jgi:hypothetical protein